MEYVLCHYGVKGMRWGVRKHQSGSKDGDRFVERRANAKATERHLEKSSRLSEALLAGVTGTNFTSYRIQEEQIAKRLLKKLNKKYDSVLEENGHDVKTGEDFVRVTLQKGSETYVSEARIYEK